MTNVEAAISALLVGMAGIAKLYQVFPNVPSATVVN
jgi:hypothetical protein